MTQKLRDAFEALGGGLPDGLENDCSSTTMTQILAPQSGILYMDSCTGDDYSIVHFKNFTALYVR